MRKDKRSSVIDIYRGLGILLVLMGHVGFGDISSHIAHAFHMPMFFFISGFLFNRNVTPSTKEWVVNKSRGVLYPYLFFGILSYAFYACMQIVRNQSIEIAPLKHLFFVNTTGMISGSLWFLTAFWISNILFFIINSKLKNEWAKCCIIFMISFVGILTAQYLPFRLPYAIDAGMVGTGLIYIGCWTRQRIEYKGIQRLFHLSVFETFIGCGILSAMALLNGEINMRNGIYHNVIFFWINAVMGSILIINIAIHVNNIKEKGVPIINKGIDVIEGIGRNSLIFVCTNDIIVAEVKPLLKYIFAGDSKLNTVFVHVMTLIVAIGIIDLIIHYTPVASWGRRAKRTERGM